MSIFSTNVVGPRSFASPYSGPTADSSTQPIRTVEVLIFIAWILACSAAVFSRTFRIAYAYDDLDQLHALATFRSGQIPLTGWLFLNHNEHILPLVRLYFWAGTAITGLNALALHILVFLTYVAAALACAWMFFSVTRSRLGAFLAGTFYAGAGGFAGSTVWQPCDAQFSISGTPLFFAMAILVSPCLRRKWAVPAVLALMVVSSLAMAATSVAAFCIPVYLYLAKPDVLSVRQRNVAIGASALLSAAILMGTRLVMSLRGLHHLVTFTGKGALAGLFFIATAPGRYLLAWAPIRNPSLNPDVIVSVAGWLLIVTTWRFVPRRLRELLLALWIGASLLTFLIGLARYDQTYEWLFTVDRYYFFFLLPLSLQTAAALDHAIAKVLYGACPARKAAITCVAGGVLLCLLAMSHSRLDRTIDWVYLNASRKEFKQAKTLAELLKIESARQSLHLVDGPLLMPGVHKRHMALACVVFTRFPAGLPGITWTHSASPPTSVDFRWRVQPISDEDAAAENRILDEWARAENRPSYSCVVGGVMQDIPEGVASCADVSHAAVR
jgi:hypothetical protein